jgi:hypothetical protein
LNFIVGGCVRISQLSDAKIHISLRRSKACFATIQPASQEVQGQLMRQAAEVASQRNGGDGWASIGSVLSATASIVAALRTNNSNSSPAIPLPTPTITMAERRPAISTPRPRPAIVATPTAPAKQSDPVGESLRQVRAVYRNGQSGDGTALRQIVAGLPPALSQAIRAGDVNAIQREVMPAVQMDPTLAEWLSQPDVGDWLTSYLQRLRSQLANASLVQTAPSAIMTTEEDQIV